MVVVWFVSDRRYRWDDVTGNQIIVNSLVPWICAEVLNVRVSGYKDCRILIVSPSLKAAYGDLR